MCVYGCTLLVRWMLLQNLMKESLYTTTWSKNQQVTYTTASLLEAAKLSTHIRLLCKSRSLSRVLFIAILCSMLCVCVCVCVCVFVSMWESESWVCLLCVLGGVTILAKRDLHSLTEILRPAAPQWRTIGGSLGILDSDLTIIQHKPALIQEGTTGYLREMLSQWLKWAPPNHPLPTLETLAVALQNSGHESLAVNLKPMFLQRKGWFVCIQLELAISLKWRTNFQDAC